MSKAMEKFTIVGVLDDTCRADASMRYVIRGTMLSREQHVPKPASPPLVQCNVSVNGHCSVSSCPHFRAHEPRDECDIAYCRSCDKLTCPNVKCRPVKRTGVVDLDGCVQPGEE